MVLRLGGHADKARDGQHTVVSDGQYLRYVSVSLRCSRAHIIRRRYTKHKARAHTHTYTPHTQAKVTRLLYTIYTYAKTVFDYPHDSHILLIILFILRSISRHRMTRGLLFAITTLRQRFSKSITK